MKQYRITTQDLNTDSSDDCYLDPNDPVHELKALAGIGGGLGGQAKLQEYRGMQGSNISATGDSKGALMKKHDIKPGTPEWFKLWFSRPYLTGEKPID
jgi:hypothetical protein